MLAVSQNNLIHNQDSCVMIYKMDSINLRVLHCTVMKQKVQKMLNPAKIDALKRISIHLFAMEINLTGIGTNQALLRTAQDEKK